MKEAAFLAKRGTDFEILQALLQSLPLEEWVVLHVPTRNDLPDRHYPNFP